MLSGPRGSLHLHAPNHNRAEIDAITADARRYLIFVLEADLKKVQRRISDPELMLGMDRRILADENDRLRAAIRSRNAEIERLNGELPDLCHGRNQAPRFVETTYQGVTSGVENTRGSVSP